MTKNVGSADRVIRIVAGVLLLIAPLSGLSVFNSIPVAIGTVVVGAVLIGTALLNFCPLYRLVGIRTCRIQNRVS